VCAGFVPHHSVPAPASAKATCTDRAHADVVQNKNQCAAAQRHALPCLQGYHLALPLLTPPLYYTPQAALPLWLHKPQRQPTVAAPLSGWLWLQWPPQRTPQATPPGPPAAPAAAQRSARCRSSAGHGSHQGGRSPQGLTRGSTTRKASAEGRGPQGLSSRGGAARRDSAEGAQGLSSRGGTARRAWAATTRAATPFAPGPLQAR
jgi:hypothetical protein